MKRLIKWAIGGKIEKGISIVMILLVLGTPVYLYITYTNAINTVKSLKIDKDKLVIEKKELSDYNEVLIANTKSLVEVFKSDSLMRQKQIENNQKTLLEQRNIIKEKNTLIDQLKNGVKCKNIFGKIVDC